MSLLYLFRHGQAGTRDDYDRLSPLGVEQAELLGAHFAAENFRFQTFLTGGLQRQKETAARIAAAYQRLGHPCPAPSGDPRWSEFDLDAVFRDVAPQLAFSDARLREELEETARIVASGDRAIHRKWTRADNEVIHAWVEGRYAVKCESWLEFTGRIRDGLAALPEGPVAIATSATPMAVAVAAAFDLPSGRIMQLASAVWNSAYTILDRRTGELALAGFNYIPHLTELRLRTYR